MKNYAASPFSFRVKRCEIIRVAKLLQEMDLSICGCYHSHPTSEAKMSLKDKSCITSSGFWWLIYSPLLNQIAAYKRTTSGYDEGKIIFT